MKILIICDLYLPVLGGAEFAVNSLARQFKSRGHQVKIVASKIPRNLPENETIDKIPLHRLNFIIPHDLKSTIAYHLYSRKTQKKLNNIIKKYKPDIVNLYFASENTMFALRSLEKLNFPFVVSLQGNDIHKNVKKSVKHKKVISKAIKKADHVTGSSASFLEDVKCLYPDITNKSSVTANGINPEDFSSKEIYQKKPYIFSIGRFEHKKGFDMLIKAFKAINPKTRKDVELLIAGYGNEWDKCKLLANNDKRIKLLGHISEESKVKLYNGCLFFALPSRIEPFGITNIEAMMAGKAVLATNVNGVPEIVNDKRGMLVEPNTQSIQKGIEKMINKRDLKKLGNNGKKFVLKNYTWSKIADKYIQIFKKVIK